MSKQRLVKVLNIFSNLNLYTLAISIIAAIAIGNLLLFLFIVPLALFFANMHQNIISEAKTEIHKKEIFLFPNSEHPETLKLLSLESFSNLYDRSDEEEKKRLMTLIGDLTFSITFKFYNRFSTFWILYNITTTTNFSNIFKVPYSN